MVKIHTGATARYRAQQIPCQCSFSLQIASIVNDITAPHPEVIVIEGIIFCSRPEQKSPDVHRHKLDLQSELDVVTLDFSH